MAFLRSIKSISAAKAIFITYLLCSILLSMSIFIRLLFTVDMVFKVFNIVMYCGLFFVIPIFALVWLFNETRQRKLLAKWFFLFLIVLYVFSWLVAFVTPSIPEYLLLWFPIPLMVLLHEKWENAGRGLFKMRTSSLVALVVIAVLLPNLTAYAGVNSLLNQATSVSNEWDKASFISQHVIEVTGFGEVPRAGEDYWKFLLTGAGLCREMSMAGANLMSAAGLVARRVVFPGEDHAFIEVKIGGSWLVADPGYYGGELISRAERATQRIGRVGSLTYVAAYTENGFIELTQQYVITDTIVIRITRNGEPLADAEVILKHTFRNLTTQLPCGDRAFHTDVNGTVTLHMGKPYYINEFKGSEEYYWVYINGEDTGYSVTSTGTDQIRLVQIDLSESSQHVVVFKNRKILMTSPNFILETPGFFQANPDYP